MTIEVLISCMHQKDSSIIKQANIQSNVIVINQCDEDRREEFTFANKKGEICNALMVYTTQRGLSHSRNMALSLATGDICIICDDDEVFEDDYVAEVCNAYKKYPEYGVIYFEIGNRQNGKRGYRKDFELSKYKTLPLCSIQTSFRNRIIKEKEIVFDTNFGAGITLAGGEEHLFMFECIEKGIKCRNYPYEMAKLKPNSSSTWRLGYSRAFMVDEGKVLTALFNKPLASLIAIRFLWRKRKWISSNDSFFGAISSIYRGIFNR